MKKRVVTILILLSLTTCLLFGCAGEKGTGNGSSDSPVTSGQDNSIMETEPESGESLSGNAEEKEAEDVRVLFSLNQKVIETVLENDDARAEMTESDIVIDQILYGSFSQPDADEVLIICEIMNMPHVGGLGRKAAIILETDSMNVVAYEELVADEVWVGILPVNNGQDRIICSLVGTSQGFSTQYMRYFMILDGQWTLVQVEELWTLMPPEELETSEGSFFYLTSDDVLIAASVKQPTDTSDITAVFRWNQEIGQFVTVQRE